MADALSRVCFKTGTDVHKAGANLNQAAADLNKAGADLNKAGADVNKEIHFITTKSCPIDIKSIQEATMQDQYLNKLKDVIFKGWPEYRKLCPQELWDYWTFRCNLVIEDDCDICNKYQAEQPKLPVMQPDLPTRRWEKLGTDISEFKGNKYLMIVNYYSRFPVIRLLGDITADTIYNHFTSVLAEYGLPSVIIADFGSQYISAKFKDSCTKSGITLTFS